MLSDISDVQGVVLFAENEGMPLQKHSIVFQSVPGHSHDPELSFLVVSNKASPARLGMRLMVSSCMGSLAWASHSMGYPNMFVSLNPWSCMKELSSHMFT